MTVILGGATSKPARVASYKLPATYTATATTITSNAPIPPPTLPTPMMVTTGNTTSTPDNPGMTVISVKTLTSPEQTSALRSAASNTALAFNLPVTISADRATALQNAIIQQDLLQPATVIDNVVIPP